MHVEGSKLEKKGTKKHEEPQRVVRGVHRPRTENNDKTRKDKECVRVFNKCASLGITIGIEI